MKLAFSTNAYMRMPLEQAIERIASIGYEGVELMADVPHLWPAGLLEGQKQACRDALHRYGLDISNINAFMMNAVADPRQPYWYPSWIEPYAPYRRIRIEHTKRALTLAKELSAPNVTTEPGGPVPPQMTFEVALRTFVEVLKPVVEHAEQYLALADKIQSPALGVNLDIGHMYCVGEDPAESVRMLAPHIRHVHLEDIAPSREHRHLIPGHGAIDFRSTLRALKEIGYKGWITIELYPYVDDPDAAAREAFAVIKPILDELDR